MRVLIACEFSGIVREAFRAAGHFAVSADFLPTEIPSIHHHVGDVRDIISRTEWDMMLAFPPCTHLARCGARWWNRPGKREAQAEAIEFVRLLMAAPIPRIAIENPLGILSTAIRKPDQVIQPWMFGHGETKATCLWLKGLPPLMATQIMAGRKNRIHMMGETKDRWKKKSRTYEGIAQAMAAQWGGMQ